MYSTNSVRMSCSGGMVGDLADAYRPKRMHVSDGTDVRGVRCGCEYRPIRAAMMVTAALKGLRKSVGMNS